LRKDDEFVPNDVFWNKNLREPNFCGKKHHLAPNHTFPGVTS